MPQSNQQQNGHVTDSDPKLEAVLFDMDGTLVETDSTHIRVMREVLKPFGHDITDAVYKERMSGKHNPEIFSEFLPSHYTEKQILDFGEYKEEEFRALVSKEGVLRPLDGLLSLLEKIERAGLKTAIVTNACRANAEFMAEYLAVKTFIPLMVIGDECPRGKPHPDPYQDVVALAKLNVNPRNAVVFEDSPSGVRSAVSAEICTIGIASTRPHDELKAVGCSAVVDNYATVDIQFMSDVLRKHHIKQD